MFLRRLLAPAFFLLASVQAGAAIDPVLFQDLNWRLLGPFRGGRVLAVSGVPKEPLHFYFGSVNGGVWETVDAGRTWRPIFDSQPIGSIGALAVAPSAPRTIYVGSGEADMRSDISQGNGVYKTTDGGATWRNVGLADSQQIGRVVVHPENPDVVYVAALGHPYGPNAERGLFRSVDGGKSWKRVLGQNENVGAIDVAFEPGNPRVLYAALWQTRRTPWSIYPPSNGPGSGLYKSSDGGDTWRELKGNGLPDKPGRIGLAVALTRPQRVYALIDAEKGGMYRSDDGGANWTRTSDDIRIWGRGWYFGGVTVEPRNADVVYSCNTNLHRSEDGGKTFVPVKGDQTGDDYHELWIDPENPERRILGVDQGALVSLNGGSTWSSWYNQPTGQFYHVSTDNRFPYWVYGAQQDSGAAGIPSRTGTYDGINAMEFHEVTAGGESDNIAPDPNDPDIIYGGRVDRLDVRTHQAKSIDPTLAYPGLDRRTWTLPLAFSRRDSHVLYFSNQRLFRTDDGGQHWTVISPDLTRENPGAPPNLDPITADLNPHSGSRLGVIYALAPSRLADHDLWVGTDDGLIWRTKDEGQHWDNITPAGLGAWSKVGIIDVSHFDPETAYAAVDRHRIEDTRPYIYRTHDGGKSWKMVSSGIPEGSFVNAIREDPIRKGLLYAGTERGVYVSFDDGDHWQSLQMNLPVTSVRDLEVNGDDLVIGTHGRGFWVIDNVTPLRQMNATVAGAGVWLFQPAAAVRERPAGFTGTPLPKDEPMAVNPPFGAYIDYVLQTAATAPVTVDIVDGAGKLVRHYSSAEPTPKADPTTLKTAPEWFVTPSTLATSPGMHRFIWPLRYAALPALAGPRGSWADGVWAPPGEYRVVLRANGQELTQPLRVRPDPRLTFPLPAYAEQFALATEVTAALASVAAALDEADTLNKKFLERRAAGGSPMSSDLETVRRKAMDIAEVISATTWWIPPKHTTSLQFLNFALEKLQNAVDGADGPPTRDARESFDKLRPPAEAAVRAWNAFKENELKAMNSRLKGGGEAELVVP
ncbi:MAG TPA: hypothetical protein VHL58_07045 [Thermoanaerobaculia bacterium]|nr:hypothetical protein [Thermoanaerobaculia bacterium]